MNFDFIPISDLITVRDQVCQNSACRQYLDKNQYNIVVHSRRFQRFQCTQCRASWVRRKGTPYYRLRTEIVAIKQGVEYLMLGLSIRRTAKRLHVSPSTIQRWKKRFLK